MWTPEDFPGADHVPWQLLIRARYMHEIDAVIASHIVRTVGAIVPLEHALRLTEAGAVRRGKDAITAEQKVGALSAIADFDDHPPCGNEPKRWPPKKRGFEEAFDPIAVLTLAAALDLVQAGSPALQEQLGGALKEIAATR